MTGEILVTGATGKTGGRLTRLLTVGQRRAKKGDCHLTFADLLDHGEGQLILIIPPVRLDAAFEADLGRLARAFPGRAWLAAARHLARIEPGFS